MATRFVDKGAGTSDIRNLPDAAGVKYDTDDGFLKYNDAGTVRTVVNTDEAQTLTNKTLTAPTLASPTITSPAVTKATETVTATNVIAATETGKTFFLGSDAEFASTLPAPAAGLEFEFIVSVAPSGSDSGSGSYTVVTNGSAQIIFGHVIVSDGTDSAADFEATGGATTVTFVDSVAVVGDRARFISDGTNWYVTAFATTNGAITITG